MSNIPPLLSSSPPPLDITDDNDDFIDVVTDEEYPYDGPDQNFNQNTINEDIHYINEASQIENEINSLHNIEDRDHPVLNIIQPKFKYSNGIEMVVQNCNNNEKTDSATITLSKLSEPEVQPALDNNIVTVICDAPINEVVEFIETPPPLNDCEENILTQKSENCENHSINGDVVIVESVEIPEVIPNSIKDKDSNKPYDVVMNDDIIKSVSNASEVPDILVSCNETEVCDATLNVLENVEYVKPSVNNYPSGINDSDDFDDFDNFISAPETTVVNTLSNINLANENVNAECVNKNVENITAHSENVKGVHGTTSDCNTIIFEDKSRIPNDFEQIAPLENNRSPEEMVETDEDSDDSFGDFTSQNIDLSKFKNDNNGDFEVTFESTSIKESNNIATSEQSNITEYVDDLAEEENDFGDFSSFSSNNTPEVQSVSNPTVFNFLHESLNSNSNENTNALTQKIQTVVTMMFPASSPECPDCETNITNSSKEDEILVLPLLKDLEVTNATTFQWRNSKTYNTELKALGIDSRNIMYGPRWCNGIPRFAANLSCPLEPLKPTPAPTASSSTSVQPAPANDEVDTNEVPVAKFDWASAGLVNPLDCSTDKVPTDTKELESTKPTEKKELENNDTQMDLTYIESNTQFTDCSKPPVETNNSTINPNTMNSHSFHLPETHIYTSPIIMPIPLQENKKPEQSNATSVIENLSDRYKLPENIFNDIAANSFKDVPNESEDDQNIIWNTNKSLKEEAVPGIILQPSFDVTIEHSISKAPLDLVATKSLTHSRTSSSDNTIYNYFSDDNLKDIPISKNTTVNPYDLYSEATNTIANNDLKLNTNSKSSNFYFDQTVISNSDSISEAYHSNENNTGTVDLDTSFNDFQSYESNQRSPFTKVYTDLPMRNISNKSSPVTPRKQNTHSTSQQILTPMILQPTVTNNFTPSIDWSSAHNNHSSKNAESSVDDSQTEWTDFVSINTVTPSKTNSVMASQNKVNMDINAFKVPIKIDYAVKSVPEPVKETDGDDWSDFVSSRPVQNTTNTYRKPNVTDKWNRSSPQFSNWQAADSYHMPHLTSNYARSTNSNHVYNQHSVLNDYKSSMKFHTTHTHNAQLKHSTANKQKNSVHNEISSISSVPELGFVVPQSLMYLSNLPKK